MQSAQQEFEALSILFRIIHHKVPMSTPQTTKC